MEIWKDVVGYEGIYKVSSLGRIKRVGKYRNQTAEWESERVLKPAQKPNGYKFCQLSKNNETKAKHIHRLVAEAFIPNPDNKPTVNHKNGNKEDNRVENLEWATYTENNLHSMYIIHGYKKGDRKNGSGSKRVIQIDMNGEVIAEFPSYREAQRQTGIKGIDVVCRGEKQKGRRQYTAGGYLWKYKDDCSVKV